MGKVVLVLWIAAIAFGGFWFGYYQEGANQSLTIEMEMQGNVPGSPFQAGTWKLCVTGSKLALVGEGKGGGQFESGKIIVDMSKKEAVLVIDKQKVIVKVPFELVAKSDCKKAKEIKFATISELKRQPDAKTIAGYRCHAFTAQEKGQGQGVLWLTYELSLGREQIGLINKILRIDPGAALGGTTMKSAGKRPQISSFDYFPVPLSMAVRSRQGSFSFKVTSIKRGKVDESLFEVPSGYHEVNFKDVFGKMFQGFGGQPSS
jgi:hypothetical protein